MCQQYYLDTSTPAKAQSKSREDRASFMPSSSISASSTMADSAETRASYLSAICRFGEREREWPAVSSSGSAGSSRLR
jgi:hypothetical protein